jgi:hypothetical protein
MVKPISLYNAEIAKAHAYLIQAGRGEDLKRIHADAVMREARANVERAQEQRRLKRSAVLLAQKAIHAVRLAYAAQEKVADEFDCERWLGLRDFVISELERIVEGRRP